MRDKLMECSFNKSQYHDKLNSQRRKNLKFYSCDIGEKIVKRSVAKEESRKKTLRYYD